MKKILLIAAFLFLLTGCVNEVREEPFIITGTVVEIDEFFSSKLIVQMKNDIKMPLFSGRYSHFTNGLEVGDKVSFEVIKNGNSYEIIGVNWNVEEDF